MSIVRDRDRVCELMTETERVTRQEAASELLIETERVRDRQTDRETEIHNGAGLQKTDTQNRGR